VEIKTTEIVWQTAYKLLTGAIVPRPIGWISTIDEDGVANLAPFSFFNIVSGNPPHVLFCVSVRGSDGMDKDTLKNVRANGQFVVNIVSEELAWAMNQTAEAVAPDVDEFAIADLTQAPSMTVKAPRVGEAPIHFECQVTQIVQVGEGVGSSSIVIGEVLHIHVDDDYLIGSDKIDTDKLRPIGRLAGAEYARMTDRFTLVRPPDKPKS
jgi:flavin reductase (DIM6/NTAB) family NADH-FMN oxidoreductase RutF